MIPMLFLLSLWVRSAAASTVYGFKNSSSWLPRIARVTMPTGEQLVHAQALPRSWDWRDVDGQSFVSIDMNQHAPVYCGACWVFAAVASLNDRIKIYRHGAFPDVSISRQVLINCIPGQDMDPPGQCGGGDAWMVYKYMYDNKVSDESCSPFIGKPDACEPSTICENCWPPQVAAANNIPACFAVKNWIGYGVGDHGEVKGEVAMMKEIYARGSIACHFVVTGDPNAKPLFVTGYDENALQHEGVYVDNIHYIDSDSDHVVSVAGWGQTPSGLKYWIVRNSWGTYWAENGWFKVQRGVNQQNIEGGCSWATPTFSDLALELQGKVMGDFVRGVHPVTSVASPADEQIELQADARHVPSPISGFCAGMLVALGGVYMGNCFLKRADGSLRSVDPERLLLG